jgi:hypothetical protein
MIAKLLKKGDFNIWMAMQIARVQEKRDNPIVDWTKY